MSAPAPTTALRLESEEVRRSIVDAAETVQAGVPDGRWKSLALTALEEALMWANKAIFNEARPDVRELDRP